MAVRNGKIHLPIVEKKKEKKNFPIPKILELGARCTMYRRNGTAL